MEQMAAARPAIAHEILALDVTTLQHPEHIKRLLTAVADGVATGDEAPFQTVILTENATEQVKFTSANALAKKYTVRVRQAR